MNGLIYEQSRQVINWRKLHRNVLFNTPKRIQYWSFMPIFFQYTAHQCCLWNSSVQMMTETELMQQYHPPLAVPSKKVLSSELRGPQGLEAEYWVRVSSVAFQHKRSSPVEVEDRALKTYLGHALRQSRWRKARLNSIVALTNWRRPMISLPSAPCQSEFYPEVMSISQVNIKLSSASHCDTILILIH